MQIQAVAETDMPAVRMQVRQRRKWLKRPPRTAPVFRIGPRAVFGLTDAQIRIWYERLHAVPLKRVYLEERP